MKKKKGAEVYNIKKNYALYILLDKEYKEFYIWYSVVDSLANTYRRHFTEQISKTKNWFEKLKRDNKKPCIFILEIAEMTRSECYALTLIWNKIFLENDYKGIESEDILNESQDIYEKNIEKYEKRKIVNLNEIVNCDKCILPKYSSISCNKYSENGIQKLKRESRKKKRIEIPYDEIEYEFLERKALETNKKITQYIKEMSLNGEINNINFDVINEFTKEMHKFYKIMNAYLITIISTYDYYPSELEKIQESVQEIKKNQKEIIRTLNKEIKVLSKLKTNKTKKF